MKKIFQLIITISIGLTLNSCYYDSIYEPIVDDNNGTDTPTDLTYTDDIDSIFGFCSSCHNGSLDPDLREGFAYDALVPGYVTPNDSEGSQLYIFLNNGHQNLTASQLEVIKNWIDQGAIE